VLNPCTRVPVSLIVDDSTCLMNLAHFCIPQFQRVFPAQFQQPWRTLPREIPDAFVRKFADWCHASGVKGKYSVIPYPACAGTLDRGLPGWSRKQLADSLRLLREHLAADWDFHPEMVSHTRVVDTRTGRPVPGQGAAFLENWGWASGRSADQIAEYLAYALRILDRVGIRCQGVTSPGGFGEGALVAYAEAVLHSTREVGRIEIPHYVKHALPGDPSVAPRVHLASGLDGPDPRCVVQIIKGSGDHYGGWDGLATGSVDRIIGPDLQSGEMPGLIRRGEPAIMLCHWPGMYANGGESGFRIFQEAVARLRQRFADEIVWMKLSEIARYWAAKELTRIERDERGVSFTAPFASPAFTVHVAGAAAAPAMKEVADARHLASGTWTRAKGGVVVCFDLPRGASRLDLRSWA